MKTQRFIWLLAVTLTGAACAQNAGPSPSAPPKLSAAELEKLVAPIALYPDPLIATILPASVYPLEIVQAARFVQDTNNLAKLDEQPWDENVKAVARIPAAIKKMNDDLSWTVDLGEAFLAQDKDVTDMIQTLRAKAQKAGTLQTTPEQVVTVTNMVVEKTVSTQVVYVTNTIVQIESANPQVIYVPTYNPYTVYYPPPYYVYNPVAPLITFGAGIAMGAIIANNCNWYHGGCYHSDVNINVNNNNINRNNNNNINRNNNFNGNTGGQTKWQPDQNRLNKSGANTAATSAQARGWGSGTKPTATTRPATTANFSRPATTPATSAGNRPTTGAGAAASRPAASPATASRPAASPATSRPSPSTSQRSSSSSAFGGMSSGSSTRAASSRGASSRGGGGGGGRGGGGRR